MIAWLDGELVYKSTHSIIVNVSGVGYEVYCPLSSYYEAPEVGSPLQLHVFTYVREDRIVLYGFLTVQEKELFSLLIAVSGVGPSLAIKLLSNLSVNDFVNAIKGQDVSRFKRVPGVGLKTSERIILETREKVLKWAQLNSGTIDISTTSIEDDVRSALNNLGYADNKIEKVLRLCITEQPGAVFDELLKGALRQLTS